MLFGFTETAPFARFSVRTRALVIMATAACGGACSNGSPDRAELPSPAAEQAVPVRIVTPAAQAPSGDLRLSATIRSKSEATLSAKTTAQIVQLDVRVGDRVKKGQVLARLDSTMAAISLKNAKATERLALANSTNARVELERASALRANGSLADAALDRNKMAADIAEAQVDQARAAISASAKQISDSIMTAPFAGVVSARFRNAGDTVSAMPPTPLLALVDPEHLELRMSVSEALVPVVRVGGQLSATGSPSGTVFNVRVSAVGASVDSVTRTVEVLADVLDPVDPLLRPGTLATVDLSAALELQGVFLPSATVVSENGKSYVFVVVSERAQRRPVAARSAKLGTVLITEGLAAKDAVVRDPTGLHDGAVVRALAD